MKTDCELPGMANVLFECKPSTLWADEICVDRSYLNVMEASFAPRFPKQTASSTPCASIPVPNICVHFRAMSLLLRLGRRWRRLVL